jgi:hypothetical protein
MDNCKVIEFKSITKQMCKAVCTICRLHFDKECRTDETRTDCPYCEKNSAIIDYFY